MDPFHVNSLRKQVGASLNQLRVVPPVRRKLRDKDDEVRIAHGNRDAGVANMAQIDFKRLLHHWRTHVGQKVKAVSAASCKLAAL